MAAIKQVAYSKHI